MGNLNSQLTKAGFYYSKDSISVVSFFQYNNDPCIKCFVYDLITKTKHNCIIAVKLNSNDDGFYCKRMDHWKKRRIIFEDGKQNDPQNDPQHTEQQRELQSNQEMPNGSYFERDIKPFIDEWVQLLEWKDKNKNTLFTSESIYLGFKFDIMPTKQNKFPSDGGIFITKLFFYPSELFHECKKANRDEIWKPYRAVFVASNHNYFDEQLFKIFKFMYENGKAFVKEADTGYATNHRYYPFDRIIAKINENSNDYVICLKDSIVFDKLLAAKNEEHKRLYEKKKKDELLEFNLCMLKEVGLDNKVNLDSIVPSLDNSNKDVNNNSTCSPSAPQRDANELNDLDIEGEINDPAKNHQCVEEGSV